MNACETVCVSNSLFWIITGTGHCTKQHHSLEKNQRIQNFIDVFYTLISKLHRNSDICKDCDHSQAMLDIYNFFQYDKKII